VGVHQQVHRAGLRLRRRAGGSPIPACTRRCASGTRSTRARRRSSTATETPPVGRCRRRS
jgi:hypothetical protein